MTTIPSGASASSSPETPRNEASASTRSPVATRDSDLETSQGKTTVADPVVSKIAGLATRQVTGVAGFGSGAARAMGAVRERIPGARASSSQGVAVEVGERQAAIDLTIVVEYGVAIVELARSIRRNVIGSIEQMTGLEVVEVNISVVDLQLPGEDTAERARQPARVE
ncbi:Asp23/Gls24 family envelope stress response protein [Pseudonocardia xinjiangensis]|uniref:Asp23/Gls24 family envelope stress response protein n=1 Tax=Pseudonocardia xinjiangensis TaxID=75289 RepID=A0ABX1RM23_9PSEU|nr:Asp23/Gls24 family envelope stress response protein [Pseudonocardia xinjiangensis]NMH80524.1 Asp23/Gls24 family envelope stress response protein [Pseudonocardia xinjiangensis]